MSEEIISLREFARRMGVGEKTIRDGVKTGKISKGKIEQNGKPKIIFDIAKKEFEDYRLGGQTRDRKQLYSDGEITNEEIENYNSGIAGLDGSTSLAVATRAERIFKAQKASLEVDELAGLLVRKETVYKELFKFGSILKNELQAVPDRITDELISLSSDRDAFHMLLSNTIEEALLRLSDMEDIDL